MELKARIRAWINENAPILRQLYQNKYVEMVYDRFASYPAEQQRQFVYGGFFLLLLLVSLLLLSNFWGLFEIRNRADRFQKTIQLLLDFKKHQEDKKAELKGSEQNAHLGEAGALKKLLLDQGRMATISPRMVQVEEIAPLAGTDPKQGASRQAKVRLQRVNLIQLKSFLQNVEHSPINMSVNSLRVQADDKAKGYLNAEIGISVYIVRAEEEG